MVLLALATTQQEEPKLEGPRGPSPEALKPKPTVAPNSGRRGPDEGDAALIILPAGPRGSSPPAPRQRNVGWWGSLGFRASDGILCLYFDLGECQGH